MGMVFVCEEAVERPVIPEDTIHRARLVDMKTRTFNYNGEELAKLQWFFEITDGEFKGETVRGETDQKLSTHSRNRFRQWAEAITHRDISGGAEVNTDDLVGLPADISIAHKPDKKDPSKVWVEVDGVIGVASGPNGWGSQVPF